MTALLWGLWASALLVFLMAAEYGYRRTRKAAQRIVPDKLEGGSVRANLHPVVRVTDEDGADATHYAPTHGHPIRYSTLAELLGEPEDGGAEGV